MHLGYATMQVPCATRQDLSDSSVMLANKVHTNRIQHAETGNTDLGFAMVRQYAVHYGVENILALHDAGAALMAELSNQKENA